LTVPKLAMPLSQVEFGRKLLRLAEAVTAVCPNSGVGGVDETTININFLPEATPAQISAANAVVAAFDWSLDAQIAWEAAKAGRDVPNAVKLIRNALDNPTPLTDTQIKQILKFIMKRLDNL